MKTGLNNLLNPNSVAVFGVSEQDGKAGNSVAKNLLGSSMRVYGINPKGGILFGSPIYRHVEELPEVPDLAVIALPAGLAPEAVRVCAGQGIKTAIVIAGGFGEVGEAGRKLEMKLKEAIAGTNTRILGPNTLGVLIPRLHLDTIFLPSTHLKRPGPGNIAVISQSGSGVMGALDIGAFYGVGLGAFVGLGNRIDIDENELIQYFAEDPQIAAIGLYLESFADAEKFFNICRKVTPHKPIALVKAGRSSAGARAVALHTGSLAGSDRVTGGVLKQAGVFRAYDDEELLDTVRILARGKPLSGRRVAVLTGGGGMGVMIADYIEARENGIAATLAKFDPLTEAKLAKMAVPYASVHNPIDLTPAASNDMYDSALEILQDDLNVDVIIICILYHAAQRDQLTERLCYWGAKGKKQLIVATMGSELTIKAMRQMEAEGVLVFPSFWRAVKAVDVLYKRAEYLRRIEMLPEMIDSEIRTKEKDRIPKPGIPLAEDEIKMFMRERGIATPDSVVLAGGRLHQEIPFSFPLVVKLRSPDVLHKTELQGVVLNITDQEMLNKILEKMRLSFPDQDLLVEQMESGGVEIIVGLIEDSTFGLSIMCGIGGTLAELYQDVAFRKVPINRLDACSMLCELKAHALLEGFRGAKVNREALIELLLKVSDFGEKLRGHIEQMDLNPVILREDKAVIVDAKLIWKNKRLGTGGIEK